MTEQKKSYSMRLLRFGRFLDIYNVMNNYFQISLNVNQTYRDLGCSMLSFESTFSPMNFAKLPQGWVIYSCCVLE